MGVPKFFRYISERYPCLSEVVREYQIPEFDNLYLDMNGIIHMCSHPDDDNVHFRITEEQIFKDIFHYIEVLFRMIKPQKLFFMAVDGVAPRAKMNQQRGRRFRSAKDAEKRETDAAKKGEILPEEERFDSNCITPGTVFMARLHEQLKYFVVDKISNDVLWQKCKVILSGHETPGEGEHKIMDYIRYMRAQPQYNPNTRHCLYGLDADLIMLGLCSHEPRFSLLREEVKFGRKSTKRVSVPEETTFYLLHLSLMREYLELEFGELKESLKNFEFDIDKLIDDWVLMGFLVGNDFIPHLPNLHIVNGALPFLYKAYMQVLPTLDGYINESGELNLLRFEKFMQKLSGFDLDNFEEIRDDLLYMEAKTGRKQAAHSKVSCKPTDVLLETDPAPQSMQRDSGLAALIQAADDFAELSLEEQEEQEENYTDLSEDEAFTNYKREYYQNKLEFTKVTPEIMRAQSEGYVRAIQWNLNYYYKGCCSWSWYYPHHYAPYISDIKGFSNLDLQFDLGKPFHPFEQLLAVLPPASKNLLPDAYHDLMTNENSPIKEYYPDDFQTDLNGKKQEWEAVVLIPFIDENRLLEAMSYCNANLTEEETQRNKYGPMLIYTYSQRSRGCYNAPKYFPPVLQNHTEVNTLAYDEVVIPSSKLVIGVHPKAQMKIYYPGFPTMKHLKYKAELKIAHIKVFDYASRGDNMVVSVEPSNKIASGEMIPVDLLGSRVFVKWPHLTEAKVVAISNSKRKYVGSGQFQYNAVDQVASSFQKEIEGITQFYQNRLGIDVGETKVLVYVQTLMGKKYSINADGKLSLEKQFTTNISYYPLQIVVYNISSFDDNQQDCKDIDHIFPKNSICFTLTNPYYGAKGVVQEKINGRLRITVTIQEEPDFRPVEEFRQKLGRSYKTLHSVASQLAISNNLFSRITGSIFIKVPALEGTSKNVNIGLDLKMNKKNLEIPGYTKKIGSTWHYSDKAADLVRNYCQHFPEVFEYLASDSNFDDIDPEHIFGENWEERVDELKSWLRTLPSYGMQRQICGSTVLEADVVTEIEKAVDLCLTSKSKHLTMQIKPNFLYRPEIQSGTLIPDPKMNVKILDRIVNVRYGYSVPFGLKGTVIAIQESLTDSDRDTMYDVVFDSPFKDGMSLSCSPKRGYRLPKYSFINISFGKRLLEEKTGKPDDAITASQNSKSQNTKPNKQFSSDFLQSSSYQQFYNSSKQFGQQNSAFAQFASSNHNRQPFEKQDDTTGTQMQNRHSSQNPYLKGPDHFNNVSGFRQQDSHTNYFQKQSTTKQSSFDNVPVKIFKKSDNEASFNNQKEFSSSAKSESKSRIETEKNEMSVNKNWRSNQTSTNITQKRPQNNDNILKNILKTNEEHNRQINPNISSTQKSSNENPSGSDFDDAVISPNETVKSTQRNETSVSFDQFSQIANAPASIRLLTYYQSNGLGLPRYQYIQCSQGVQAQITLSDGNLIVGKPASTREDASENVAADVLNLFLKNKVKSDNFSMQEDFPVPPKTWVQSEKDTSQLNTDGINKSAKAKTETSALLNNSFVPLQAVKNHITKSHNNDGIKENVQNQENVSDTRAAKIVNKQHTKPKKERKTRIAANFFNKK